MASAGPVRTGLPFPCDALCREGSASCPIEQLTGPVLERASEASSPHVGSFEAHVKRALLLLLSENMVLVLLNQLALLSKIALGRSDVSMLIGAV